VGKTPTSQTLVTTLRLLTKPWSTLRDALKALDAMLDSLMHHCQAKILAN
jgi:hypothetical protein